MKSMFKNNRKTNQRLWQHTFSDCVPMASSQPTGMPREIILGSTHQKGGGKGRKNICQFTRPWHGRNKEDANCPHGHPSEMHTANLDSRDTYRIMVSRVYVNSDAPIFRRLAWQNHIHRRKFVAHGFQTNLNGQF